MFKNIIKTKNQDNLIYEEGKAEKTFSEVDLEDLAKKVYDWGELSRNGLVCGIYGCNEVPTVPCRQCHGGYCDTHYKMHSHEVNSDGIYEQRIKD